MSNVRQIIMWCYQLWRDESPTYTKQLKDSKILHAYRSVGFAIYNEHEKSRMKEVENELASLISFLNLGSEEMHIEEYVQLAG